VTRHLVPILAAAAICLACAHAGAVPQMSLLSGAPCATCHVAPGGGGLRNEIGWYTSADWGAFTYEEMGVDALAFESNTFADGYVAFGYDARVQWVRAGRPPATDVLPDLITIPMQIQPGVAVYALDWLTLYGSYNVGPRTYEGEFCDPHFEGQECFEAAVLVDADPDWPALRAGMISPSHGIKHDDHTLLYFSSALDHRRPLLPPNHADLGGELGYQPTSWLRADTGVYLPNNLDLAAQGPGLDVAVDPVSYLGRVSLMPQYLDAGLNSWVGLSVYGSGEFRHDIAFVGLGLNDTAALQFEVSRFERAKERGWSAFVEATGQVVTWLHVLARAEVSRAKRGEIEAEVRQYVFGAQIFPVPYLELRPEYRLVEVRDEYLLGQVTLQVHQFF
jgi:hypothetical protein